MMGRQTVIRALLDAADVDIQLYSARLIEELKGTQEGRAFADWAACNPATFQAMLRAFSIVVQRNPRDMSALEATVRDQLARLPAEVARTIDEAPSVVSSSPPLLADREFSRRYEEAVTGLSDSDLKVVAGLAERELRDWVYSPPSVRPHKLAAWGSRKSLWQQFDEGLAPLVASLDGRVREGNQRAEVAFRSFMIWMGVLLGVLLVGAIVATILDI
jgi:hypothetical protein